MKQTFEPHPWEEGEGLYQGSVVQYEEDHWKVELRDIVEPTMVAYRQLSPWRTGNIWHKW
jgi:hypothetical protein